MRVVLTRVGTAAVILVLGLAGVFTASPAPAGGLGRGSDFGRYVNFPRLSLLQPRALRRHPGLTPPAPACGPGVARRPTHTALRQLPGIPDSENSLDGLFFS